MLSGHAKIAFGDDPWTVITSETVQNRILMVGSLGGSGHGVCVSAVSRSRIKSSQIPAPGNSLRVAIRTTYPRRILAHKSFVCSEFIGKHQQSRISEPSNSGSLGHN